MLVITFTFVAGAGPAVIKDKDQASCLLQNSINYDNRLASTLISDPTNCTTIINSCCYARIQYNYGDMPYNDTFCFVMSGDPKDFYNTINNWINDEVKWYSNYTYNNYAGLSSIGNNLNYTYYSNYSCYNPPAPQDFSNYYPSRCMSYDANGTCLIQADDNNFNQFVTNIFTTVTSSFCNSINADTGLCDSYIVSKNPNGNDPELNPLLTELIKSLSVDQANNTNSTTDNSTTNGTGSTSVNNNGWPNDCKPQVIAVVTIICPDNYTSGDTLMLSFKIIISLFIVLLL